MVDKKVFHIQNAPVKLIEFSNLIAHKISDLHSWLCVIVKIEGRIHACVRWLRYARRAIHK